MTSIRTIPDDFQVFCEQIGATFVSCQSNGGLEIQIWTGTFIGGTDNIPGEFFMFCTTIGAEFVSISNGSNWTAVFTV